MSFELLAPHYRWMEFVLAGDKLQRCRTAFLDSVGDVERVFIAGEGNGRFLTECRRKLKAAHITCLDASARMLGLARGRVERQRLSLERINFVHSDLFKWNPPPSPFDLVVTHFFLDCFRPEQLRRVIELLAGLATPNARWLLADFQVPAAGFYKYRAQAVHWLMYAFFRVAAGLPAHRLTPPDEALRRNGFVLRDRRESEWGLLHTDEWSRVGSAGETQFRESLHQKSDLFGALSLSKTATDNIGFSPERK